MKHATLRQLKVFESVARLLSFSRAAEELHLTQPAVSTQIRKLEEHAGLPLFEQFGKKIYLTPAGSELLDISRGIIQQFELAESAMTLSYIFCSMAACLAGQSGLVHRLQASPPS